MTTSTLSVVVPVYNSAPTMSSLMQRIREVLEPTGIEFELVLVNDGSRDESWQRIVDLSRADPRVHGMNLARNYGQHNALLAGIRAARHAVIVTLDDDLQNPPEEIPKLLAQLDRGYDVVYGKWPRKFGFWRNLATSATKLALRGVVGSKIASDVGPFRAFRTHLRDAFADFQAPYVSIDVLLSWGTTRFTAIPVAHVPRAEGSSSYSFGRLATHALNVLTGFSTRPLRIASLVGLAFTLFGMAILALVLGRYLIEGGSVPGFPFLASLIAIFSGAQLLTLGIIGEYVARMHARVMDRPSYSVREEVGRG